jgi:putative ATP-dependent endonuclease of OLD family
MDDKERAELQRMMDITRATLYFAKAAILVEGFSDALIIPVLARRMGHDLAKLHISVIPICGVAFETFKKLLSPSVLGIPVAIVTDADPPVKRGTSWNEDTPEKEGLAFKLSDRMKKLASTFSGHQTVKVFHADLTLEYDLAKAGVNNAAVMAQVWEGCFDGKPKTFNYEKVAEAGTDSEAKALAAWRGICRADHSGSKAEFAQSLSAKLVGSDGSGECPIAFAVPDYLEKAILYVVNRVASPASVSDSAKT